MRQLTCEMTEEQKEEFCKKHNLDKALLEDNCPCPKENGIAIFPEKKSNIELEKTVQQLTDHLAKMTLQLNSLTNLMSTKTK